MTEITLFAQRLKEERKRLRKTQAQMAEACGVARETWGRYESGSIAPSSDVLASAGKVGINVVYVLAGGGTLQVAITPQEMELIDNYRLSHHDVQRGVSALLRSTCNREEKHE